MGTRASARDHERRIPAEVPRDVRADRAVRDRLPQKSKRRTASAHHDDGPGQGFRRQDGGRPLYPASDARADRRAAAVSSSHCRRCGSDVHRRRRRRGDQHPHAVYPSHPEGLRRSDALCKGECEGRAARTDQQAVRDRKPCAIHRHDGDGHGELCRKPDRRDGGARAHGHGAVACLRDPGGLDPERVPRVPGPEGL